MVNTIHLASRLMSDGLKLITWIHLGLRLLSSEVSTSGEMFQVIGIMEEARFHLSEVVEEY